MVSGSASRFIPWWLLKVTCILVMYFFKPQLLFHKDPILPFEMADKLNKSDDINDHCSDNSSDNDDDNVSQDASSNVVNKVLNMVEEIEKQK